MTTWSLRTCVWACRFKRWWQYITSKPHTLFHHSMRQICSSCEMWLRLCMRMGSMPLCAASCWKKKTKTRKLKIRGGDTHPFCFSHTRKWLRTLPGLSGGWFALKSNFLREVKILSMRASCLNHTQAQIRHMHKHTRATLCFAFWGRVLAVRGSHRRCVRYAYIIHMPISYTSTNQTCTCFTFWGRVHGNGGLYLRCEVRTAYACVMPGVVMKACALP